VDDESCGRARAAAVRLHQRGREAQLTAGRDLDDGRLDPRRGRGPHPDGGGDGARTSALAHRNTQRRADVGRAVAADQARVLPRLLRRPRHGFQRDHVHERLAAGQLLGTPDFDLEQPARDRGPTLLQRPGSLVEHVARRPSDLHGRYGRAPALARLLLRHAHERDETLFAHPAGAERGGENESRRSPPSHRTGLSAAWRRTG